MSANEKRDSLDSIVNNLPDDLRDAYMMDFEFRHLVLVAADKGTGYVEFLEEVSNYYVKARAKEREEAYNRAAGLMDCAKSFNASDNAENGYSATYESGYNNGRASMMKQNIICLIIAGIIIAIFG